MSEPSDGSVAQSSEDVNLLTGLKILLPFAKHAWLTYTGAAALASLSSLALLGPFWAVYRAVDDVVAGVASREAMFTYAALAAGFLVTQYLLTAASSWMSHRGAFATLELLRLRIGARLGRVPLGFLTNRRSGEIQRTLRDDIERLELFLAHFVPDIVSAFTTLLFLIAWLVIVDWRMALVSLAVVAVALPIMAIGTSHGSGKMGEYTRSMARMNASIVEFVRAMPVVRTFNGTRRVYGETRAAINDTVQYEADWAREIITVFTAFYVLVSSPVLTILPLGLWLWHTERVDTSTLLFSSSSVWASHCRFCACSWS